MMHWRKETFSAGLKRPINDRGNRFFPAAEMKQISTREMKTFLYFSPH